mmetsp:Transcript_9020/g.17014  ORF Transcript_9020/g.17014 Transcript_9020/m.17014 type:complete len:182 (+) Transcript_9020:400-945(+)
MTITTATSHRRRRFGFGKRVTNPEISGQLNAKDNKNNKNRGNNKKPTFTTSYCPADILDKLLSLQEEERQEDTFYSTHDYDVYQLCREATEACLRETISHLYHFLQDCDNHDAKYEDWIKDVHPENVDGCRVDHRFYIKDSEHLSIWNALMETLNRTNKIVVPRTLLVKCQDSFQEDSPRQ